MMRKDKINIYKIAEMSGVSVTTVSNVINNKQGVGEKTRKTVLEVMRKHKFSPKISKSSAEIIGIFVKTYKTTNPLSSPYIYNLIEGIYKVVNTYGFNTMIIPVETIPKDRDGFKLFCQKRGIDAGIFLLLVDDDNFVVDFSFVIPIVTVGVKFNSDKIYSVTSDNEAGGYEVTKYFIDMGHSKIAFFAPGLNYQDHNARMAGYKRALADAGINIEDKYIINHDYSFIDLGNILDNLFLSKETSPTAIIAYDDQEAIKISNALTSKGISIPDDVSIIGFDDYISSKYLSPPLTTVKQPVEEMGEKAAQMVFSLLNNDDSSDISSVVFKNRLIPRKSVKDIR